MLLKIASSTLQKLPEAQVDQDFFSLSKLNKTTQIQTKLQRTENPKHKFMDTMPTSTLSWLPLLILLLLLPILSLQILLKIKRKKPKQCPKLPPSPPRLPIIGNLHQLGKLPHQSLYRLSQEYGPIMLLQLGNIPTLVISSAEFAKQVLKTHDLHFCSRPRSPGPRRLSYNFLDVAFSPYSDSWRATRKLFVSELFSAERLKLFVHARQVEIDHLIESLSQSPPDLAVNIDEKIFALVDGIVCRPAFGKSYGGKQFKDQKFHEVIGETMKMMNGFSAEDFFPSFGWIVDLLSGHRGRLEKCFGNLDEYFERLIDDHLGSGREKLEQKDQDFIDVLVGLLKDDESSESGFTKDHIKALILNTFIGGIDTIAVAVVWAMSEVIKNPHVMQKLQEEIRSSLGKKSTLDPNDISDLKYLKMVVKETLRLHPPAPLLIPHECLCHCKLGDANDGYDVYAQTRVLINAWAIGRDPNSWTKPNEFFPDRFEENNVDFKGQHFELVPFGAGRRICPSIGMASSTVQLILANLLYCFDWEMPCGMRREDISMEEEGGITTHKKAPLCLVPIRYDSPISLS